MAGAASNYLEGKILDHVLRVTSFTQPSGLYLALFTADPGEDGAYTNEISSTGSGYSRKAVTFAAASGGTSASSTTVTFDAATASWGTVTHVAICDSATRGAGNVLFYGPVTTSKTIDVGDTFQVTSSNLTVSLD